MQGYYRLPNLLISGKIYSHLADIEEQAQDLFSRLVKEHAEKEGVTEYLKAIDQMKWVQKMNNESPKATDNDFSSNDAFSCIIHISTFHSFLAQFYQSTQLVSFSLNHHLEWQLILSKALQFRHNRDLFFEPTSL